MEANNQLWEHNQFYLFIFSCRAYKAPFYIGVLIPFIIIYLFNWIVFLIIIASSLIKRTSLKKTNTDTGNDSVVKSSLSAFNNQLIVSVIQSVIFGLSWGIGLLMTEDTHSNKFIRDLFTSLFVILTSLHGLFIFIIYCLCSKDVWNFMKRMCSDIKGNQFHLPTFVHTKGESTNSSPLRYPNYYLETKLNNPNLILSHENTGKLYIILQ